MDTRVLSMARSLRLSASVGALVLFSIGGAAFAQQQGDAPLSVPFSALSASAQQEILMLQNRLNRTGTTDPLVIPVDEPVARSVSAPLPVQSLSHDDRRARANWTIGVYR